MPPDKRRIIGTLAVVLLGLAALCVHAAYYYPFISDDALISMRYAQRFLDGDGLTWNDGERVEGYSNFLWMMAAAAPGAVGVDLIHALRILGLLGMWAVVLAMVYAHFHPPRLSWAAVAIGVVVWVLAGPTAAWVVGGLETPLLVALLVWSIVLCVGVNESDKPTFHAVWKPGLLLGLLCITRPDGVLFAASIAGWFLWSGRFRRGAFLRASYLLLIPALFTIGQLAFRLAYYGEWLPNTAYVKISPSLHHLKAGLVYVAVGIASMRPLGELSIIALIILLFDRVEARRRNATLLVIVAIVWLSYVAFIGGDIFPGWRHLVPFIAVMVLAVGLVVDSLATTPARLLKLMLVLLPLVAWFVYTQFNNPGLRRAKEETWVWNSKVVGLVLKRGFGTSRPTIAVTAAGGIPYWSELPSLDLLGLNDRHIARSKVPDAGQRWIGHGAGDIPYVLERRPDMMLFGTAGGRKPYFTYEDLNEDPVFTEDYSACHFSGDDPYAFTSMIYVDRNSQKIGIRNEDGLVLVPSYLINAAEPVPASLDDKGRFFVTLKPNQVIGARGLRLTSGRWELVEPVGSGLSVALVQGDAPQAPELEGGAYFFDVAADGTYDVLIKNAASIPFGVWALRMQKR
jgi:arabinofuranosyltransferase